MNFTEVVLINFIIGSPIARYQMTKWLEDYAYKTQIGWDVFAITGFTAIMIALLTISYPSIKAAMMNPAESLRSE